MPAEQATRARSARVIVVGNEKGGSGKSTVAMHIAIALLKSGQGVATIDLDIRQRSFTRYIENRRMWAEHVSRDLGIPERVRAFLKRPDNREFQPVQRHRLPDRRRLAPE